MGEKGKVTDGETGSHQKANNIPLLSMENNKALCKIPLQYSNSWLTG